MTVRFRPLELVFALFLAVVLVRILPFTPRTLFDPAEADAGAGLAKQALYVAGFVAIVLAALPGWRRDELAVPIPLLLLLAFAGVSLSWSVVPAIGARRLALAALVAVTLLVATLRLRPRRTLDLLRWTTVALAVATLLAGLFDPAAAIHQPGDPESSVVGAWRGIFYHKNLAGGVIGLGLLLSVDALVRDRRWATGLAAVLVTGLALYLTRSKTSEIAALAGMVILFTFRAANLVAGASPVRATLLRLGVAAALAAALLVGWFAADLQRYVLDPEAFTGRGQLWAVIGKLVAQRPLWGHGFESVFQAGDGSVLAQLAPQSWIRHAPHSHNGPLDLLVTLGAIGLAFYCWALIVDPWLRLSRLPDSLRRAWQPTIAALIAYALVHSMMEGKMFSGEGVEWALLVIVVGISVRLKTVVRA